MMQGSAAEDLVAWIIRTMPDEPVFVFDAAALTRTATQFRTGFPGLVTYAVKANPDPRILRALIASGLEAFDVASPAEMALVRGLMPTARLHYHNPVRSRAEIAEARRHGIASWSVDRRNELDKLGLIAGQEIAVRLKLSVAGAAYDFGSKFGADPDGAATLLRTVAERGGRPALTFHPGTQMIDPAVWPRYIHTAAEIARIAGVDLTRLNVGGGFPSRRGADAPDLQSHFDAIAQAARDAFPTPPPLVCEPGRAIVAECMTLVLRVKSVSDAAVTLNDGVYGALGEWRDLPPADRIHAVSPEGRPRTGAPLPRVVFGPTCDSVDRLPMPVPLPSDLEDEDYLVVDDMGAYAAAVRTGFNGYGAETVVEMQETGQSGRAV